jgi:hypothetical protein
MLCRRSPLLALGATLVMAAACSDSTGLNGTLTAEERSELALQVGALARSSFMASGTASRAADGLSARTVPVPFRFAIDVTVPCPRGGNSRVTGEASGTVDNASNSIVAEADVTHRPNDCGVDVHGKTFRISGVLTTEANVRVENGVPIGTQTATLTGNFDWESAGRGSGTCAVSYSASVNYQDNKAVVTGNFCGSTISYEGPLTS